MEVKSGVGEVGVGDGEGLRGEYRSGNICVMSK